MKFKPVLDTYTRKVYKAMLDAQQIPGYKLISIEKQIELVQTCIQIELCDFTKEITGLLKTEEKQHG